MTILWEIGGKGRKNLDPRHTPRRLASPLLMLAMGTTALVCLAPAAAHAQTIWDGSASSDWFTGTNWDTNAVPTMADDAIIDTNMTNETVIDGAAAAAFDVYVGYTAGNGELTIQNGGTLATAKGFLGYAFGTTGLVTVNGPVAGWTNTGQVQVGVDGSGTLNIANGASVSNQFGFIGFNAGSDGAVNVSGAGSSWSNGGGNLSVGHQGSGYLAVTNGAHVDSNYGSVGNFAGSQGVVLVYDAGSQWYNNAGLTVGSGGTGSLFIANGGSVESSEGIIGAAAGSNGIVVVSGTGSTWSLGGNLTIGDAGTGLLSIAGAAVSTGFDLSVGAGTGSGTLVIDPVGQLTVGGNVTIGANALYMVTVGPTSVPSGSLIDAMGMATIDSGAVVEVQASAGNYAANTTYTILTADGGVTGTFGGVSTNLAFLDVALTYDPTNAFLTLTRNDLPFYSAAGTPNQVAAAGGVEALGAGNGVYDAMVGLSDAQAKAAFDAVSGEGHASIKGVLIENSGLVRDAVLGRLDTAFGAPKATAALGYAGAPILGSEAMEAGLWSQLYCGLGNRASDGNAARADFASGGLVLGTDGLIGDWRLGLLANAGITSMSIPDRSTSGNSTDYGIGLYGGTNWGDTGLSLGAAYARHAVSTTRDVSFPGFTDTLTASYGAATGQLFGELNHEFDLGKVSITPFAQAAYVNHATDAFTEQGGAAALSSAASVIDATFTTLGLRSSHQFVVGEDGLAELTGGIGWRHAFADTPIAANSFAGGSAFTVAGAPMAGDALTLEGGLTLDLASGMDLALTYDGQIARSGQAHVLKAGLGGQF